MMTEANEPPIGPPPEGEAHVWTIALHGGQEPDRRLLECLSDHERQRLQRFTAAGARMHFALTRWALRHILSRYTGIAAAAVELQVDPHGKPTMAGEASVHFSLSHAPRLALIAVAPVAVGIDIERVRSPRRMLLVARRVLHPDTVEVLTRLARSARQRAFLDAWTQRESHVKAVGGGLFITPDTLPFDVAQPADGRPYPRRDRGGDEWTVARFYPEPGAHAALVARGHIDQLRFFGWRLDTMQSGESV